MKGEIFLQSLENREVNENSSIKSHKSRREREFFSWDLENWEEKEKWKIISPARERKNWLISSRDFLEIETLVNDWRRWVTIRKDRKAKIPIDLVEQLLEEEKGKNCQTWPSWQEVNGGEKVEIKESGKVDWEHIGNALQLWVHSVPTQIYSSVLKLVHWMATTSWA